MHVVIVHVQVKPEYIEAFKAATIENAKGSIQEAGIAQFDFLQQDDDPTRFILYEVYRSTDAPALHRETAHYLKWRETVKDMMAGDRIRTECTNVYPPDTDF